MRPIRAAQALWPGRRGVARRGLVGAELPLELVGGMEVSLRIRRGDVRVAMAGGTEVGEADAEDVGVGDVGDG